MEGSTGDERVFDPFAWPAGKACRAAGSAGREPLRAMTGSDRLRRSRVLVVDDDGDLRDSLKHALELEGYVVDTAVDGDQALRALCEHRHRVVVTDLLMPGRDGIEAIFAMIRQAPETRIVAMTGGGQIGDPDYYLGLAMRAGAFRALAKPFAGSELMTAIRDAFGEG